MNPKKKWIVLDNKPSMHEKSVPLTFPLKSADLVNLEKMQSYIDACFNDEQNKFHIRPGIGISACQIGWNIQAIYIHFFDGKNINQCFIANPKIISYSKQICYLEHGEGCLSTIKHYDGIVPRKSKIIVEAIDLLEDKSGTKKITIEATGLYAICLQHEIDHLSGIMFYDHINPANPWFKNPDWVSII